MGRPAIFRCMRCRLCARGTSHGRHEHPTIPVSAEDSAMEDEEDERALEGVLDLFDQVSSRAADDSESEDREGWLRCVSNLRPPIAKQLTGDAHVYPPCRV